MKKLMMIPGSTPVDQSILNALSKDTVSHLDPEFVKILKETLKDLKIVVIYPLPKGRDYICNLLDSIGYAFEDEVLNCER